MLGAGDLDTADDRPHGSRAQLARVSTGCAHSLEVCLHRVDFDGPFIDALIVLVVAGREAMPASEVDRVHASRRIAMSGYRRRQRIERRDLLGRQRQCDGAGILLDALDARGCPVWGRCRSTRQQPCQRELSRRTSFLTRQSLDGCDQVEIPLKVVSLKAGVRTSPVVREPIFDRTKVAGEKTASQWAIRDESDPQAPGTSPANRFQITRLPNQYSVWSAVMGDTL